MQHKTRYLKFICIFLIAGILLAILPSGCRQDVIKTITPLDNVNDNNYKMFTAQTGIPHFSFEYPASYKLVSYQPLPDFPSTSLIIVNPEAENQKDNIKHIEIHIVSYIKSAEDKLNGCISDYRSTIREGLINNFLEKEKTPINLFGINGWEYIVSYTTLPVSSHGMDDLAVRDKPLPVVSRHLFLEYQNLAWEIHLFSDAATDEQAQVVYEHVIRTLKMLP